MPIAPTLCGLNLWLVALVVPLSLLHLQAGGPSAPWASWALSPLAPLCLLLGLWRRDGRIGQALLLVGVPLLSLGPGVDGAVNNPRLWPRAAVGLELLLLIAYLVSVCRLLAAESSPLSDGVSVPRRAAAGQGQGWQVGPLPASDELPPPSTRLQRRLRMHRLLIAYAICVPALFVYALDLHAPHLRALRASFGSPVRIGALQATATAGLTLLCSVLFYFCWAAPLSSHISHHRDLRAELHLLRSRARRGRPGARLWLAMGMAIVGMAGLIYWSVRGSH